MIGILMHNDWIVRRCPDPCYTRHVWEPLNPTTMKPYKHGRVVFLCDGFGIRDLATRRIRVKLTLRKATAGRSGR